MPVRRQTMIAKQTTPAMTSPRRHAVQGQTITRLAPHLVMATFPL
jgi:hypothetical protein